MAPIEELLSRARHRRELPPPALRKALREQAQLSLREVAEGLGVSPMALLHWERGSRSPNAEHLPVYAAFLRSLQQITVDPPEVGS